MSCPRITEIYMGENMRRHGISPGEHEPVPNVMVMASVVSEKLGPERPPDRTWFVQDKYAEAGNLHVCKHCSCVYWVPNE